MIKTPPSDKQLITLGKSAVSDLVKINPTKLWLDAELKKIGGIMWDFKVWNQAQT